MATVILAQGFAGSWLAADGITVVGLLLVAVIAFATELVVSGKRYRKVLEERDEAVGGRLEDAQEMAVIARALVKAKEKENNS